MRANKVKSNMAAGRMSSGCLFNFRSLQLLEMVGILGFDYVLIGEHGAFSLPDIEEMCIVADRMGLTVMARLPDSDPATVVQYLDRGVLGIEAGHLTTKDDVDALVRACKFAPRGHRSFAGHRIMDYSLPEDGSTVMAEANEQVVVIAHLESLEALANLPEILTVEGLDAISIGSFDLSQSLGHPGRSKHPDVVETVRRAADVVRASQKIYAADVLRYTRIADMVMRSGREYLRSEKRA